MHNASHEASQSPSVSTEWFWFAAVLGGFSLFAYLTAGAFDLFPWSVGRILFYAYGPTLALASVCMGRLLRAEERSGPLFELGTISAVIAGIVVNMMAVIQDSNFTLMGRARAEAQLEATKDSIDRVMQGVNTVQMSLDIVFDIWISLATTLFALGAAFYFKKRIFGAIGVVIGSGALGLNFATLPDPPADLGFLDPGPLVASWLGFFLAYACWRYRRAARQRSETA